MVSWAFKQKQKDSKKARVRVLEKDLLIKNAKVVSSSGIQQKDVLIQKGKITQVESNVGHAGVEMIDAKGLYLLPGVLDPQVHFREPGATWKEDLHTGSMAAAAGGVTGFFDMPNNNPSITTRALMAEKKKAASEKCVVNYNFFIGATPDNLEEINAVENVCGIKIFMGSSTGNLLVEKQEDLEKIFANGTRLIAVHAEDNPTIETNKKKYAGSTNFNDHWKIRSAEAALIATKRAVDLALRHNRRLHILHLTTADEVEFLRQYKDNPLISCEVCPQHLLLWAPDVYDKLGAYAQMNPPIREKHHSIALWQGLKEGVIKCMATDHAPHTREEKAEVFGKAPSGMPGVETLLPLMLNQVSEGKCSLEEVVLWLCERPVELYGVLNKGYIKVGFDADLVLVDMNKEQIVKKENLFTKVGWSSYEGLEIKGWPVQTFVGGETVFKDGKVNEDVRGREILIG
jgi:dihydroorotase